MREDWAEKLKQKLAGHRKTPPAGLWEGISLQMSEMGFTAEPVRQKSVSRRLYWAAAAAVLALVGFFVFHSVDDKQPLQAELSSPQPISPTQDAQNALEHEPLTVAPEPVLALAQTVSPHRATKLKEPVTPQVSAKPEVSVKSEAQETFKQEEAVKQEEPVKSEEPVKQEDTKTFHAKVYFKAKDKRYRDLWFMWNLRGVVLQFEKHLIRSTDTRETVFGLDRGSLSMFSYL